MFVQMRTMADEKRFDPKMKTSEMEKRSERGHKHRKGLKDHVILVYNNVESRMYCGRVDAKKILLNFINNIL